jgi:hypothetical protein
MLRLLSLIVIALALVAPAVGQERPAAGTNREQNAPGAAGPKGSGVVQRGEQPNAAEVRPGNRDGDAPSAAAGELVPRPGRRIFGLPANAALVIGGVLIVLAITAGILVPGARRRDRARGGGTYGGGDRRG